MIDLADKSGVTFAIQPILILLIVAAIIAAPYLIKRYKIWKTAAVVCAFGALGSGAMPWLIKDTDPLYPGYCLLSALTFLCVSVFMIRKDWLRRRETKQQEPK